MNAKYAKLNVGQKIQHFTVLSLNAGQKSNGASLALFQCACGNKRIIQPALVQGGFRKSCGCVRLEKFRERLRKRHEACRAVPGQRALKVLFKSYRARARAQKLDFALTRQQFNALVRESCAYCGAPPSNVQRYYDYRMSHQFDESVVYTGIDRRNNKCGYTPENCVACCKICNFSKRDMTEAQFLAWVDRVHNHRLCVP